MSSAQTCTSPSLSLREEVAEAAGAMAPGWLGHGEEAQGWGGAESSHVGVRCRGQPGVMKGRGDYGLRGVLEKQRWDTGA